MGLLRVQFDVLHELFLRLRRERARAVHPRIGTPDRVSHRSSLPFVTAATPPPERANVNRLFRAALLATECRVAPPPKRDTSRADYVVCRGRPPLEFCEQVRGVTDRG